MIQGLCPILAGRSQDISASATSILNLFLNCSYENPILWNSDCWRMALVISMFQVCFAVSPHKSY